MGFGPTTDGFPNGRIPTVPEIRSESVCVL